MKLVKGMTVASLVFAGLSGLAISSTAYAGNRTFVFDPGQLTWSAYENGQLVKSGRASGGSNYCRDLGRSCHTPSGVFSVSRKGGPDCRSSLYPKPNGGAWMGYCMFFSGSYAIHASNAVPNYNASHGCIRVTPAAAQWLSANFIQYGTKVVVKSY